MRQVQGEPRTRFDEKEREMNKEPNGAASISRQICDIEPSANVYLLNHFAQHFPKIRKPRRLVTRSGERVRGFYQSLRHGNSMPWETFEELALIAKVRGVNEQLKHSGFKTVEFCLN